MSLFRDTARAFDQRLRLVSAVVDLPADVDTLRQRLTDFQHNAGRPILDRLAQAAIDGHDDLDLLWAAAVAENTSTPAVHNEVLTGVRGRIHTRIREAYAVEADTIYRKMAAVFDSAAAKLSAAHTTVDIEASAESVLDLPDKQRKAWREAHTHAGDLTRLLPALKAAAVLAGVCDDHTDNDLPLAVDAANSNRRDIWTAWETDDLEAKAERQAANNSPFTTTSPAPRSRCGRWSAVLRVGAIIRACPPDQFTEYRRPKPMVEQIRDSKRVLVDPEADDYQPPQPPTFTPAPRIRISR